jgi:hypothetical protein
MQLANSNYSLEVKNYNKRTPATLKFVADLLLVLIPFVETISLTCPDFPGKKWVFWGIITAFSLFKVVSKFVADQSAVAD